MRRAELVMAAAMAIFSLYLMWKSAELPIGWISGEGPGGGAFPFWLAVGMLICSLWVIVNWIRRASPPARSTEPFFEKQAFKLIAFVTGALLAMIGAIHVIGVYGAVPLFIIFYMQFLGRHRWTTTGAIAVVMPVATFFFFEIALKIALPKGLTEPLFFPLYRIFL
jgi:hypothetical protein